MATTTPGSMSRRWARSRSTPPVSGPRRGSITGSARSRSLPARARVSVVRLAGVTPMHGVATRDMTAPVGGPFVTAAATIDGSEHAFLRAGLETGYLAMRLYARVDDVSRTAIDLRGAWLTATLSA